MHKKMIAAALTVLGAALSAHAVAPVKDASARLRTAVDAEIDHAYGDAAAGLRALQRLAVDAPKDGSTRRLFATARGLLAADNGLPADARAAMAELEALEPEEGQLARADALLVRADLAISENADWDVAFRAASAAVDAYAPFCEASADPRCDGFDWFYANMWAGVTALSMGKTGLGATYLQTARAIGRAISLPALEARATALLASSAQQDGDAHLADRLSSAAITLAREASDVSVAIFVRMEVAKLLTARHDLPAARQVLQSAHDDAVGAGLPFRVGQTGLALARSSILQGHPEACLEELAALAPLVSRLGDAVQQDDLDATRLLALVKVGRLDDARAALSLRLATLARVGSDMDGEEIARLCEAFIAAGARDDALALFEREQAALIRNGDRRYEPQILRMQGLQKERRMAEVRLWGGCAAAGALAGVVALLVARRQRERNRGLAVVNAALHLRVGSDPLTGLANRAHLEQALREHGAVEQFAGAVLLLDIDHFKRINDGHGHAGGDAVLVAVAARLRACVRPEDVVARWGGEEFVIVAFHGDLDVDALSLRVLERLAAEPVGFGDEAIPVTASIGAVQLPLAPGGPMTFEAALAAADVAMYQAKRHGRDAAARITRLDEPHRRDPAGIAGSIDSALLRGEATIVLHRRAQPPFGTHSLPPSTSSSVFLAGS